MSYTQQDLAEAIKLYSGSEYTVDEIAERTGVPRSTVSGRAIRAGITPRIKRNKVKTAGIKCSACGKEVNMPGAAFCPFCGADIRSDIVRLGLAANDIYKVLKENGFGEDDDVKTAFDVIKDYINNHREAADE